jgi:hypothetical protein
VNHSGYGGRLGEIRIQRDTHGGIEYRTPPSWVISEGITESLMCLAYMCADSVLKNVEFGDANWLDRDTYRSCDKNYLRARLRPIFDSIHTMPLYPTYKTQIDALNVMCRMGLTWKEDEDVLHRWGIRDAPVLRAPRPTPEAQSTQMRGMIRGNRITSGGDAMCGELVEPHEESYRGRELFIYGLSDRREEDVCVASAPGYERISREIRSALEEMGLNVSSRSYGSGSSQAGIRMGISYNIRRNNFDQAQRIVAEAVRIGGQ